MAKRVIVVGAGVIGAAIAWHLAKAGVAVTVIDAAETGGLATRASFAWINASWGNPEPYFRLRQRSMADWRTLDREVPGLAVNWCGGLLWDIEGDRLEAYAREHTAWGYGIERVRGAGILAIEPNLKQVPEVALHVAGEGMVEPVAGTRALLAGAERLGAEIVTHMRVKWLAGDDTQVTGVLTEEGTIHGDEVVLAAGAGTVHLLESAGLKLKLTTPPGLLVHSKPAGELLRGLVMTPGLHVRQTAEGRLVAGADFAGTEQLDRPRVLALELLDKVRALVRGAEDLEFDFHTLGYRPTPADGFPAVGRLGRPGLYVAVTHSGITLAPAIGRFAAEELLEGTRDPLLAPYDPCRAALH